MKAVLKSASSALVAVNSRVVNAPMCKVDRKCRMKGSRRSQGTKSRQMVEGISETKRDGTTKNASCCDIGELLESSPARVSDATDIISEQFGDPVTYQMAY
jgi:hypothetical protein